MRYLLVVVVVLATWLSACRQDRFVANADIELRFETDSVLFDTVFTTVGTITKRFKVYNPTNQNISIDEIFLGGRRATGTSNYRLNINGQPLNDARNVQLLKGDSLYIFVEATIDPNSSLTPYLVVDSVMFRSGNKIGKVNLTAFGQNAHFVGNEVLPCDTSWTDLLPIVVYQSVLIDTLCKLTIQPGTRIYFAKNATLFVLGTLEVNGSKERPVEFRGDRLDPFYNELAGAWNGIRFLRGSVNNRITYANLRNGTLGIQVDSLPVSGMAPSLVLRNSSIQNFAIAGLVGFTAHIEADNVLIAECGRFNVYGDVGGIYNFRHCTLASYGFNFSRSTPVVLLSNAGSSSGIRYSLEASFRNSIITGNRREEMVLDTFPGIPLNVVFRHNILRTERPNDFGVNNLYNADPRFKNAATGDYNIDTMSMAFRFGENLIPFFPQLATDLEGNPRGMQPTLGALERIE